VYSTDLAYIHHAGFNAFAHRTAPELIDMLRGHGIRRGLVVDVGCGSGPLAAHLIEAGYDVLGIDASAAMIRLARSRSSRAKFRRGSLTATKIPRCAAVVALNEVIGYVPDPRGRLSALRKFFARAYKALRPGGLLVFDFMASAERRTYSAKSRSGSDWAVVVRASADRSGRALTRQITTFRKIGGKYRKMHETHRVHVYSQADIQETLRAIGFRVRMRRSYGQMRLLPGDVAVVAEKSA